MESFATSSVPYSAPFASSMYQSQNSAHRNWYSVEAASAKPKVSSEARASVVARWSRDRIHRSASVSERSFSGRASSVNSPMFIRAKRLAFHSLLQKAL